MATYTIDTAAAMERLEHGGLDHDQAKAIVDTFREAHEELVSKEHFDAEMSLLRKDFDAEMSLLRKDVEDEMSLLRKDFDAAMSLLRKDFEAEMSLLRKDVEGLKGWMTTRMLMAQVGTVAALYGLIRLFGVG